MGPRQPHDDMQAYLERFGTFGDRRVESKVAWAVADALNLLWQDPPMVEAAADRLSLLMVSLEQVTMDNGRWDLAWMYQLMEESLLTPSRPGSTSRRSCRLFLTPSPTSWRRTRSPLVDASSREGRTRTTTPATIPRARARRREVFGYDVSYIFGPFYGPPKFAGSLSFCELSCQFTRLGRRLVHRRWTVTRVPRRVHCQQPSSASSAKVGSSLEIRSP